MAGRYVVTGASSGIGAALAASLVADGHEVVGIDRSPGFPDGVVPIGCDLADPGSVRAATAAVRRRGRIDGLANIAGVPGTAPAPTVLAVNVLGLRSLTEGLLDTIVDGGSIVLLSSLAGYRSEVPQAEIEALLAAPDAELLARVAAQGLDGPAAYQLSKKIVHRYAVELAARLLPRRVRCSSVSPGPVATPILADFRATMASVDLAAEMVGRHGTPEEVAAAAAFLLSPASSWVNGIDLCVDGGLLALRTVASRQGV